MTNRILNKQKDQLTKVQEQVLQWIIQFIARHGYSPTEGEIAIYFKFSRTAAQYHLNTLKFKRRIKRVPKWGQRNIVIVGYKWIVDKKQKTGKKPKK